jgi:septum formation protein
MVVSAFLEPIILASASPRRRELLSQAGVRFSISVPGCDETPIAGESAEQMVQRLAVLKASAIAKHNPMSYVIGADTTVYIDGEVLGKPASVEEACQMLEKIQGKTHEVWGGIAVVHQQLQLTDSWTHVTSVKMRPMTRSTIEEYVATGEPMDKAGSYAIQGIGLQFVESIQGSYSNVVGLNIASVMEKLRELSCK